MQGSNEVKQVVTEDDNIEPHAKQRKVDGGEQTSSNAANDLLVEKDEAPKADARTRVPVSKNTCHQHPPNLMHATQKEKVNSKVATRKFKTWRYVPCVEKSLLEMNTTRNVPTTVRTIPKIPT